MIGYDELSAARRAMQERVHTTVEEDAEHVGISPRAVDDVARELVAELERANLSHERVCEHVGGFVAGLLIGLEIIRRRGEIG